MLTRRGFLKLLGVAAVAPVLAKLPAPAPSFTYQTLPVADGVTMTVPIYTDFSFSVGDQVVVWEVGKDPRPCFITAVDGSTFKLRNQHGPEHQELAG